VVLEFFKGGGDQTLEQIQSTIVQMLLDDRHTFDLAINAVMGGTEARAVGKEVRKTDRGVNKAERSIRRQLVVYSAVRGSHADLPHVLAAMSIIKDVERVGDNAKNVWDLANMGIDLSAAPDIKNLKAMRDRTSSLIAETARIYGERDTEAAVALLTDLDDVLDEYDACVEEQVLSKGKGTDAAARALLCRYLKRITAHLMNVLTSLVMPLDRLDYFDEDKIDRE
jgi:phosphate uptake regulator